jgi:hypothetical protein
MARTVAGPDGPGFLQMGIEKMLYINRSHTKQELKPIIRDESTTINRQLLHRVFDNFVNR